VGSNDGPGDAVPGVPAASIEALDALSTEELRRRAFDRAEQRHDLEFFWDLVRHLPASEALAAEDASGGGIGDAISEVIKGAEEMFGRDLGDEEPLFRARFIDYLRTTSNG
jgi:hypothetical protein